jgi:hypothetical protein
MLRRFQPCLVAANKIDKPQGYGVLEHHQLSSGGHLVPGAAFSQLSPTEPIRRSGPPSPSALLRRPLAPHELGHAMNFLSVGKITGGFIQNDRDPKRNGDNDIGITENCINPIQDKLH